MRAEIYCKHVLPNGSTTTNTFDQDASSWLKRRMRMARRLSFTITDAVFKSVGPRVVRSGATNTHLTANFGPSSIRPEAAQPCLTMLSAT